MLALAEIARNAPSAAKRSRRGSSGSRCAPPAEASAALPSAMRSPSACSGSAMKLFAYTQTGVVKPSIAAAANDAPAVAPSRRAKA